MNKEHLISSDIGSSNQDLNPRSNDFVPGASTIELSYNTTNLSCFKHNSSLFTVFTFSVSPAVMPNFAENVEAAVDVLTSGRDQEIDENDFVYASRIVYDGVRDIRRAVLMNRVSRMIALTIQTPDPLLCMREQSFLVSTAFCFAQLCIITIISG